MKQLGSAFELVSGKTGALHCGVAAAEAVPLACTRPCFPVGEPLPVARRAGIPSALLAASMQFLMSPQISPGFPIFRNSPSHPATDLSASKQQERSAREKNCEAKGILRNTAFVHMLINTMEAATENL